MSASTNQHLSKLITLGASGAEVKALQEKLNNLGVARLSADGRLGLRTLRAIKLFQQRNGLRVDGIVGPKTAKALGWTFGANTAISHNVSMKTAPLPPTTPPLMVVYEAINAGLAHQFSRLKEAVAKSGASLTLIVQAGVTLALVLRQQSDELKKVLSAEPPDELAILHLMGIGFQSKQAMEKITQDLKSSGANYDDFFWIENSRYPTAMQLGPIVQKLMHGEQTVSDTIQKIKSVFVTRYGPY